MDVPIFLDNVSQKDWYKLGMAKYGCSNLFLTIFPKRTGIKFGMAKNGHSILISNNFSQEDWYKFGMAKNGCSKFFPKFFPERLV